MLADPVKQIRYLTLIDAALSLEGPEGDRNAINCLYFILFEHKDAAVGDGVVMRRLSECYSYMDDFYPSKFWAGLVARFSPFYFSETDLHLVAPETLVPSRDYVKIFPDEQAKMPRRATFLHDYASPEARADNPCRLYQWEPLVDRAEALAKDGEIADARTVFYYTATLLSDLLGGRVSHGLGTCYEAMGWRMAAKFWYWIAVDEAGKCGLVPHEWAEDYARLHDANIDDLVRPEVYLVEQPVTHGR